MIEIEEGKQKPPSAWKRFWLGLDREGNVVAGEPIEDPAARSPSTNPAATSDPQTDPMPASVAIVIGVVARLVFWAMVWLIVGNAAVFLFSEGNFLAALFSIVLFPLTTFAWPFFSPADASAWPLANSNGLIYFFVIAAIAYPISTFVGGLRSV